MTDRARATSRWGAATAVGPNHDRNEDALAVANGWWIVADGMGGHAAGEIASQVAVAALTAQPPPDSLDEAALRSALDRHLDAANSAVRRRADELGHDGIGCTAVALGAARIGGAARAVVVHVGDARCYRLLDGALSLVTRDHSHVQELIDAGLLTTERAATHPLRSVVTRAIGADTTLDPDIAVLDGRASRWLLCTDGVSSVLRPAALGRTLVRHPDARVAADALVSLAIEAGARDDVTALVVDLAFDDARTDRPSPPATTPPERRQARP